MNYELIAFGKKYEFKYEYDEKAYEDALKALAKLSNDRTCERYDDVRLKFAELNNHSDSPLYAPIMSEYKKMIKSVYEINNEEINEQLAKLKNEDDEPERAKLLSGILKKYEQGESVIRDTDLFFRWNLQRDYSTNAKILNQLAWTEDIGPSIKSERVETANEYAKLLKFTYKGRDHLTRSIYVSDRELQNVRLGYFAEERADRPLDLKYYPQSKRTGEIQIDKKDEALAQVEGDYSKLFVKQIYDLYESISSYKQNDLDYQLKVAKGLSRLNFKAHTEIHDIMEFESPGDSKYADKMANKVHTRLILDLLDKKAHSQFGKEYDNDSVKLEIEKSIYRIEHEDVMQIIDKAVEKKVFTPGEGMDIAHDIIEYEKERNIEQSK